MIQPCSMLSAGFIHKLVKSYMYLNNLVFVCTVQFTCRYGGFRLKIDRSANICLS
jgi:hypothetical protein